MAATDVVMTAKATRVERRRVILISDAGEGGRDCRCDPILGSPWYRPAIKISRLLARRRGVRPANLIEYSCPDSAVTDSRSLPVTRLVPIEENTAFFEFRVVFAEATVSNDFASSSKVRMNTISQAAADFLRQDHGLLGKLALPVR